MQSSIGEPQGAWRIATMAELQRLLGLLAIVGLTACFDPRVVRGAPCNDEHPCPRGQACVVGVCGGSSGGSISIDAGPAEDAAEAMDAALDTPIAVADRDGDGAVDTADNCPELANPDQGDEDGDHLGDVCDPCPIDVSNSDPDGDGVAGICDPRPSAPGDRIAVFEGFHRGIPSSWQVIGTASPLGDDVAMTNAVNNHTSIVSPVASIGNGTIMASLVIDATLGAPDAGMTVAIPYDPTRDAGIFCEVYAPDASSPNGHYLSLWDSPAQSERARRNFAWTIGTPYRVALTRAGSNYGCSLTASGGQPQIANASTGSTTAQSKLAVGAYGASGHVAWVLAVSSP